MLGCRLEQDSLPCQELAAGRGEGNAFVASGCCHRLVPGPHCAPRAAGPSFTAPALALLASFPLSLPPSLSQRRFPTAIHS